MISSAHQAGFSAVELLITLFIAVIFLAAGHQMYTNIIRDSSEVRQRAQASSIAYDYLQRYAATAPQPCASSTPLSNVAVPATHEGLNDVRVSIQYSCPPASTRLARVQATVNYGQGRSVVHAMYATNE